jgi:hypothetical protein
VKEQKVTAVTQEPTGITVASNKRFIGQELKINEW